jgi:hypothetical protein
LAATAVHQHHGVVALDHHGTAGLAGDLAGFEGDGLCLPYWKVLVIFCHVGIPWMS